MIQGSETTAAESIAELTQALLGVALETDEVARWVQGDGLTENVPFDFASADGTVWRVTAEKFESAPATDESKDRHRFVSRLTATKGATRVRFVIDEWKAL
jgi:Outer membrane lipoprotein LolB